MDDIVVQIVKQLTEKIRVNYQTYEVYWQDELYWQDLNYVKREICICLLTEQYQAAITLTNHFLERILKLSLIYHHSDQKAFLNLDTLSEKYKDATEKYDGAHLYNNIKSCCDAGLIELERGEALQKIREQVRNGFSHADMGKVFGKAETRMLMGSFLDPRKSHVRSMPIVAVPFMQGIAQYEFAKENAHWYFDVVYAVLKHVEKVFKRRDNTAN